MPGKGNADRTADDCTGTAASGKKDVPWFSGCKGHSTVCVYRGSKNLTRVSGDAGRKINSQFFCRLPVHPTDHFCISAFNFSGKANPEQCVDDQAAVLRDIGLRMKVLQDGNVEIFADLPLDTAGI